MHKNWKMIAAGFDLNIPQSDLNKIEPSLES
jgi:hypothetical protein